MHVVRRPLIGVGVISAIHDTTSESRGRSGSRACARHETGGMRGIVHGGVAVVATEAVIRVGGLHVHRGSERSLHHVVRLLRRKWLLIMVIGRRDWRVLGSIRGRMANASLEGAAWRIVGGHLCGRHIWRWRRSLGIRSMSSCHGRSRRTRREVIERLRCMHGIHRGGGERCGSISRVEGVCGNQSSAGFPREVLQRGVFPLRFRRGEVRPVLFACGCLEGDNSLHVERVVVSRVVFICLRVRLGG